MLSDEILRRIERTWSSPEQRQRAREVLASYGPDEYEPNRVRLAILKVSEGDVERLPELVAMAKTDYRDVLMWAEFPEEGKALWSDKPRLSREEERRLTELRARDRRQYEEWRAAVNPKGKRLPATTTAREAKAKAAATYNAAADSYDATTNTFWDRFGRSTIERMRLRPGERVLDVCCGCGASAIPAAEAVGQGGSVTGVDLADHLLALARAKARARGLSQVEFQTGDMLDLRFPDADFDAVVCVFGVFFVPDMAAAVREMWRVVRSGGRLAITTWGPRFFEPANGAFWDSIREVRPDLYKGFNPWDLICDPHALRAVLEQGGVHAAEIVAEPGSQPIPSPEAWWTAVLGTGYRGTLEQLDAGARERVRTANLDYIRRSGIREVEANVVYALAEKP